MNIPVLVEQLPDHRYRAKCGEPFVVSADGNTDADAVNNLRASYALLSPSLGNRIVRNASQCQPARVSDRRS
jgi:hypothetical protein